jgi:tetratricopeptide (TPR) repeat protein
LPFYDLKGPPARAQLELLMYFVVVRPRGRWKPPAILVALIAAAILCGCDDHAQNPHAAAHTITFHHDIAPIVSRQCTNCHHPGGSAPFSLVSFDDVKKHAAQIVKVTQTRFMPPWLPEPGYGHFADERRLPDNEIALISQWVLDGAPAGQATDATAPTWNSSWQLGQPDLIVQMPQAYTLPASGKDVYRNFVIPLPLKASRWVRAIEFHPGNSQVVHHAFALLDTSGYARRMDSRDGELGYPGMDAGEDVAMPSGQILSWQPGRMPSFDDPARSWRMPGGADLVFQMHMRPDGKPEPLQASVGIYFTDKHATQFPYMLLLKSTAIDIPAGDSNYVIESSYTLPIDVDLFRILPHAHYLGHELSGSATFPDGTIQPLILIKNWDFNWQSDYRYASPMHLPKGTKLSMRFTYDNSDANVRNPNHPPLRVRYGPQSSDEMGELWLQVVPKNEQDLFALADDYCQNYAFPDLISHYGALLKEAPTDATARAKLGGALVAAGQVDDGIRQLRRTIEIDSSNAISHFNLGAALAKQEKIAEATEEYQITLRVDPQNYRAHNNLGMIYFKLGKFDLAAHHFYNALRINPNDVLANSNLAGLFLAEHNWGQARLQLENLLSLDPDNQPAQQLLRGVEGAIQKSQ